MATILEFDLPRSTVQVGDQQYYVEFTTQRADPNVGLMEGWVEDIFFFTVEEGDDVSNELYLAMPEKEYDELGVQLWNKLECWESD